MDFDLGKVTYWQASQLLVGQTDSRLSLYQPDGKVALIDGPVSKEPVHLQGAFRVAVKRVAPRLDFESGLRTGRLGLEIAWSRASPYLIEVGKIPSVRASPARPTHRDRSS